MLLKNLKSNVRLFVEKRESKITWVHTIGVVKVVLYIARREGADLKTTEIAALFHDIVKDDATQESHAEHGSEICEKFMRQLNLPDDFIKRVVHCVASHSYYWSGIGPMPETIEAQVLFDADMVQQLSEIGIVKHILKYKNLELPEIIRRSREDLTRAANLVRTETGKKMAKKRLKIIENFFRNVDCV